MNGPPILCVASGVRWFDGAAFAALHDGSVFTTHGLFAFVLLIRSAGAIYNNLEIRTWQCGAQLVLWRLPSSFRLHLNILRTQFRLLQTIIFYFLRNFLFERYQRKEPILKHGCHSCSPDTRVFPKECFAIDLVHQFHIDLPCPFSASLAYFIILVFFFFTYMAAVSIIDFL